MSFNRTIWWGLNASALLFACAVDIGPFFIPPATPENDTRFRAGRLGLITPDLTKENELIAFRILTGLKMDPPAPATPSVAGDYKPVGEEVWYTKRRAIKDPPAPSYINPYRNRKSGDQYVYYENCLADAFETAARTLDDRRSSYGSADAVKSWIIAQDQVFENCSAEKPVYPAALPATASALQQADRDYQIAAAHFYAEDFPEAERRFQAIANDTATPWRGMASYVVARVRLRQASLEDNRAALAGAREQFAKIAGDSGSALHDTARKMTGHLDAVEHPEATLQALSARVLDPSQGGASLEDAINQSAFALRAASFQAARSQPDAPEAFDWVETLEQANVQHAVERWRQRKSLPWLTLALMFSSGKDPAASDLLAQADAIPETSPGFGTVSYNAIRLRIERGDTADARSKLDSLLARTADQPDSLVNGWRAERMRVATNFDDLLRWSARKPIGAADLAGPKAEAQSAVLAEDSARVLNNLTPLAQLKHAAHSPLLSSWSAADVALAGWTRALMLSDLDTATDLAPIVAKAHPEWRSGLIPETGPQEAHWRFQAALLIALNRQFQPSARVAYRTELASSGSWWCPVESEPESAATTDNIAWRLPVAFTPSTQVLSEADLVTARQEIARLHAAGSTEMFLAPIIMDWAKAHPDDPQVPEALHRLVMVTRYGCRSGDPAIGQISKAAFDLLHKQYPKNSWATKTPYWFK